MSPEIDTLNNAFRAIRMINGNETVLGEVNKIKKMLEDHSRIPVNYVSAFANFFNTKNRTDPEFVVTATLLFDRAYPGLLSQK